MRPGRSFSMLQQLQVGQIVPLLQPEAPPLISVSFLSGLEIHAASCRNCSAKLPQVLAVMTAYDRQAGG